MNGTDLRILAIALADHASPRLPVELHHGPAGRLLVAGSPSWSRFLTERFFGGPASGRHLLARLPVWRLPALLERWRPRVDLVIARVDLFSAGRFPAGRYVRMPEWVRTVAAVPAAGMLPALSEAGRKQRLVRKHGLTWRSSRSPDELRTFIERDYRPYICRRYGEAAQLRSERWFRKGLRRGNLLWIERDGQSVAAVLVDRQGTTLRYLAAACCHGDENLLRLGALSATYLACFDLARLLGCSRVDLRNSRPSRSDGLLRQKLAWGGVITEADDLTHDLVLGWDTVTPALHRFLAATPLLVRGHSGLMNLEADSGRSASAPPLRGTVGTWRLRPGERLPLLAAQGA